MVGNARNWLRRRDPGYLVTRRAARVTLVACVGFYGCRYGLGDPVTATFALFGAVATGVLAQLPGSPAERARTLVAALPVAWMLVVAGTLLAGDTWMAAAGMLVIGFTVSFAGVGGPRLVGLATAFQLFYILPCFPPYAPESLPGRLAGLTLGIALLALAEVTLWPDPTPVRYAQRLADAADSVAAFLDRLADAISGRTGVEDELARAQDDAIELAESLRPSQLPPTQRPASAGARDRALRHSGSVARLVLAQTNRLVRDPTTCGTPRPELVRALRQAAATTRLAGRTALGESPPVPLDELEAARARFEGSRANPGESDIARMRPDAIALEILEAVRILATAARVAARLPVARERSAFADVPGPLWYAHAPTISLWWHQFRAHLTPRSVYFQEALRVAMALAGARVVVGVLDLAHGLWTLLAVLTLMRTSAVDTRSTLKPALVGTVLGAVASAALLVLVHQQEVIVALLPLSMLVGFTVGPLLGVGWGQGLFTVVITMVFAQLGPASWQLAGNRLVDVLVGAMIGLLTGVLAWPRGGGGELRRAVATCLDIGTSATEETVGVLVGAGRTHRTLRQARRAMLLAEASFAQYQSERRDPRMSSVDWHAALIAAHHMVHGGESLMRRYPPGSLGAWADADAQLQGHARRLRVAYAELAEQLSTGRLTHLVRVPSAHEYAGDGDGTGISALRHDDDQTTVLHIVDVDVWLSSLGESVARIQEPAAKAEAE